MSYRLIVDELPAPRIDIPAAPRQQPQGLQFVLRYSIPIFIAPETPSPIAPVLQTRLVAGEDGQAAIEIENRGSQHAQIADLAIPMAPTSKTPSFRDWSVTSCPGSACVGR